MSSKVLRSFQLVTVILSVVDIGVLLWLGFNVKFCFDLLQLRNYKYYEDVELTLGCLLLYFIPNIIKFMIYLSFLLVTKTTKNENYKKIGIVFLVIDIVAMIISRPFFNLITFPIINKYWENDVITLYTIVEAAAWYITNVTMPIYRGLYFATCGMMMVMPKVNKQENIEIIEN